jgi:hypothetical protein
MRDKLLKFAKNKYVITTLVFVFWLIFFDNFNLLDRIKAIHAKQKLIKEKAYFEEKIKEDKQKLKELQTNRENLEKFAREQYLMKKENEDIFIVEE